MSDNPCNPSCDWTDGDVTDLEDAGCCAPAFFRRDCDAPVLPTPACNETGMTTVFDSETETFTVLTTLYDQLCSAITDQNGSPITTLIG